MPAPEAYREYCIERRFWEEFGAPQPPLLDWPRRKVTEYVSIQRAIDAVEQERNRNANTSGLPAGSSGNTTAPTEEAYQRMKTQAAPPPMPPPAT